MLNLFPSWNSESYALGDSTFQPKLLIAKWQRSVDKYGSTWPRQCPLLTGPDVGYSRIRSTWFRAEL
jgi:hypothetical protein